MHRFFSLFQMQFIHYFCNNFFRFPYWSFLFWLRYVYRALLASVFTFLFVFMELNISDSVFLSMRSCVKECAKFWYCVSSIASSNDIVVPTSLRELSGKWETIFSLTIAFQRDYSWTVVLSTFRNVSYEVARIHIPFLLFLFVCLFGVRRSSYPIASLYKHMFGPQIVSLLNIEDLLISSHQYLFGLVCSLLTFSFHGLALCWWMFYVFESVLWFVRCVDIWSPCLTVRCTSLVDRVSSGDTGTMDLASYQSFCTYSSVSCTGRYRIGNR